jgi:tryptophan-rich sensory protein
LTVRSALEVFGFLGLAFAAAWLGAQFEPGTWYAQLHKPSWTPPDSVFAPVWTVLYVLIGVSGWLVWRRVGWLSLALGLWLGQLALNAAWSWLFFGLHQPGLALIEIVVLLLTIGGLLLVFKRIRTIAAALLAPYFVWVAFATALNFSLWRLNT